MPDTKKLKKSIEEMQTILHPTRIQMLFLLDKRETCACEFVEKLNIPNNLVSHHLKVLSDRGVVASRSDGLHRKYTIRSQRACQIRKLLKCITSYSNHDD